ncbi:hypothetical protein, partial [Photobacterium sanctipauli]
MRIYVLFAFISVLVITPVSGVKAAAVDVELSHYAKATHLANLGRYQQASEQWHRLTIIFLSSEAKLGRKRMWQYAGLSEALAAAAADKANSADAYQYWADSTRYLMTGGTNWDQMRKKLHRRYERANTLLSTQLQVADLASSVDAEWQQELSTLQTWDEKLGLYRFSSPKLGLQDTRHDQAVKEAIPPPKPMTTYQPRGGAKKLSGLSKTFSNEQQFVPVVAPSASASAQEEEGIITPTLKQNRPQQVNNTVSIELAETSVTRHLVVSDADIKLDTAPVMSKGIVISSPTSSAAGTRQKTISLLPDNGDLDEVVPEKILPKKVVKANSIDAAPVQAPV